jgi:hypothetical protein
VITAWRLASGLVAQGLTRRTLAEGPYSDVPNADKHHAGSARSVRVGQVQDFLDISIPYRSLVAGSRRVVK